MSLKKHSWKSYLFLVSSMLVTATILLVDSIATATSEKLTPMVLSFIGICGILSIGLAFICFLSPTERKVIPLLALIFTSANTFIISWFFIFGMNIA